MKQRVITFDDRTVELYDELELKDAPDIYIYEDELLVQENHTKYEDKQPFIDKTIYYRYNPNGLLDKIITEKGELQTISSFQYFEEY